MKFAFATASAFLLLTGAAFAGQPDAPGSKGHTNAFFTKGFAQSVEATGQGTLGRAADLFGNNGKGNGADPDALGLKKDHDPNNFGGAPNTSR